MNGFKTFVLMACMTALLVLLGGWIGGNSGALIFLMIALAMNFISYFYSDKMAIKATKSYPVTYEQAPMVYDIVEELSDRAGLPMPAIYVTPSKQPNAFATGRNPEHAAIAVTEGIMQILTREELAGVLAHEMSHIKNRDILISTVAASMAGAISLIADWIRWSAIFGGSDENGGIVGALLTAILAPIAAIIIQMAISRSREFKADESGAELCGSADGLANALLKLESMAGRIPMQVSSSYSHMFITNPLRGQSLARLFSTHPSTEERVAALRQMRF